MICSICGTKCQGRKGTCATHDSSSNLSHRTMGTNRPNGSLGRRSVSNGKGKIFSDRRATDETQVHSPTGRFTRQNNGRNNLVQSRPLKPILCSKLDSHQLT